MDSVIDRVNRTDNEGKDAMHKLLEEREKSKLTFTLDEDALDLEEVERVRQKTVPYPGEKMPWQENDN